MPVVDNSGDTVTDVGCSLLADVRSENSVEDDCCGVGMLIAVDVAMEFSSAVVVNP